MLRPGINKNPVDIVATLPVPATAGMCMVTDPRGLSSYIYFLFSATSFWRVDTTSWTWQQLASPTAAIMTGFGAGTCMCWDQSGGTIYAFGPGAGGGDDAWTARYTIATNTWDARDLTGDMDALLGAPWGTDGSLCHPCTAIADAPATAAALGPIAADGYILLVGNNLGVAYVYDIAGDAWTNTPAARGANAGAGSTLNWLWGYSQNRVYSLDGGGLDTSRYYGIAGNAWAAVTPVPAWTPAPPNTGTSAIPSCDGSLRYIHLNSTGTILQFNPATSAVTPLASLYGTEGAATVGRKLAAYKVGDREYLLAMGQSTTQLQRVQIIR